MTTTRDILIAARALIADERNWIKGEGHRVVDGRDCYCAVGALFETADSDDWCAGWDALNDQTERGAAVAFNDADTTTHADVLAMFDRAIEASS